MGRRRQSPRADRAARAADPRIEKVFASLGEQTRRVRIASSLGVLATTRRYLEENPELVGIVARIYRDCVQLFKSDEPLAIDAIGRQLPVLRGKPAVLDRCYRVFAQLFEPSLIVTPSSLAAVLVEVAQQDSRASRLRPEDLIVNVG